MTIVLLLVSLVVHELAHAVVALWLGDHAAFVLGRLTANPLAHVDLVGTLLVPGALFLLGVVPIGWLRPVPVDVQALPPGGARIVALAGPIANIVLAALAIGWGELFGWPWLRELARLNLALAGFNLLPIKPLDGWRAFRSP